ncbi:MAG TPA: hypothetical protein DDX99_07155 [Desulfofustis sp.]|jgi:flagellar biosynthesis protein FlhB|nr:hypothetical protein [Desulfofustis sp.]
MRTQGIVNLVLSSPLAFIAFLGVLNWIIYKIISDLIRASKQERIDSLKKTMQFCTFIFAMFFVLVFLVIFLTP